MQNPYKADQPRPAPPSHDERLTGVTQSLHPHCTPAQSKFPILAPHFSFGHTILPEMFPDLSIPSIHVSYDVSASGLSDSQSRRGGRTGSTKYPEHLGLTRMGGPELGTAPP